MLPKLGNSIICLTTLVKKFIKTNSGFGDMSSHDVLRK